MVSDRSPASKDTVNELTAALSEIVNVPSRLVLTMVLSGMIHPYYSGFSAFFVAFFGFV